ncbi:MAG: hypothetical protein ACLFVZ_08400 [Actinomycetota bacterium]
MTEIDSIEVDGDALDVDDDIKFTELGLVTRISDGRLRHWDSLKIDAIEVTYTAGYETVPADIVDICAWMVARAFREGAAALAGPSGVESVDLEGSDSVTYAQAAAHLYLADEDIKALGSYVRPVVG